MKAPRWRGAKGEPHALNGFPRFGELRASHLLEVLLRQHFLAGEGEGGIDIELLFFLVCFLFRSCAFTRKGFGQACGHLRLGGFLLSLHGRQEHCHGFFKEVRVLPEEVKRLIKQFPLIASVHKDRMKRPIEVPSVINADGAHRL